uniref:ribonuclease H n=1 Tax=Scleropages formosus TaxID=113540 RepID=A0A8C9TFI9_SCLFO
MAGYIGRIDAFDSATDDWPMYCERIEQYFKANGIADDKRVSVLLSAMGGKAYALLRTLTAPTKPADLSFDNIVQTLRDHLAPKPLLIAECFRFHKRSQNEGESIAAHVAELKKLSEHCQFGDGLSDALRDRLVCGILQESIQKRLLTESDLTFKRAVEIAVAMETAARDAVELRSRVKIMSVNKVTTVCKLKGTVQNAELCYRCGKGWHKANQCRFKTETCRKCNKVGHIQRACRSDLSHHEKNKQYKAQRKKSRDVHAVAQRSDEESDTGLATLEIYSLRGDLKQAIWLTPRVNGKTIRMELDTGSAVSVMSQTEFERHFTKAEFKPSPVKLKTYTGEPIVPLGVIPVTVRYNDQQCELDLYIVPTAGPALWGRDWLRKLQLDWKSIKSLQISGPVLSGTQEKLKKVLDGAAVVFQPGIGTLKHIKGRITLNEGAVPKFHKARPVPYAIRQKVEMELDRLEAEGILSKVDWSPWATPVVPVAKKDGTVRLCGDFKVSISSELQAEQYSLSRIEDIFASLSGGQFFSKIDLAEAYLQMEMEEDSKVFLTINTHKGLYRYNRLVFGVASAPALWQRAREQVLQGCRGTQCYLDDIIVTGEDDDSHLENLTRVLQRLRSYGLRARRDKCEFFRSTITYCGHEIDANGLHKCHDKIRAVAEAPQPKDVSQLRSFLGFVNYYNRFLANLATVLHPLNVLLRAGQKWMWTKQCERAFQEAKKLVVSETV